MLFDAQVVEGLVDELRRAELDDAFISPVMTAADSPEPAISPVLGRHRQIEGDGLQDGGPVRSGGQSVPPEAPDRYDNYSMRDLIERERMHPAIVRRLDDMCRAVEV